MYRILAIDYGEKRIGLALSDPLHIISRPLKTIPNESITQVLNQINQEIVINAVGKIIVGLPLNLQGEDTKKTKEVRAFVDKLQNSTPLPIILWNETYTTQDAKDWLISKGYSILKGRKIIDQIAASILLKSYMDENKD